MKMTIEPVFAIGQIVFLRTDPDQLVRMITGIKVCPGYLLYCVSICSEETNHYDFEVSTEKDLCMILGIEGNKERA